MVVVEDSRRKRTKASRVKRSCDRNNLTLIIALSGSEPRVILASIRNLSEYQKSKRVSDWINPKRWNIRIIVGPVSALTDWYPRTGLRWELCDFPSSGHALQPRLPCTLTVTQNMSVYVWGKHSFLNPLSLSFFFPSFLFRFLFNFD